MKNKKILICSIILIISMVVSCSWQLPETVSVKTQADYKFGIANINKSLDEYLDVKKIIEGSGAGNGKVKVYDYFPGQKDPNTQHYLIKVGLAEIPLDLNSIMSQIDLTSNLKAMEFNQNIVVPSFTIPALTKDIYMPGGLNGNLPTEVDPEPVTVTVDLQDVLAGTGITECQISAGSIELSLSGFNSDATCTFKLKSEGGLTINEQTAANGKIDLAGTTLAAGNSKITVTVDLAKVKSVNNPSISVLPKITGIGSATVNIGKVETGFKKSVDLPAEAKSMIESIKLKDSGFDLTYTNTLPTGNDLSIIVKSDFLGIDNTKSGNTSGDVLTSGTKTLNYKSSNIVTIADSTKVDFDVSLKLPGEVTDSATGEKKITLRNVILGDIYKLGFKITPKLDWENVVLKAEALKGVNQTDQTIDLGIDLNKILSGFGGKLGVDLTNIKIGTLPVYFFCGKPDNKAFDSIKFNGKAELLAGNTSLGYILGTAGVNTELAPVKDLPNFNIDSVVTEDLSKRAVEQKNVSAKFDLGDAFNGAITNSGNLNLKYSVGISGDGNTGKITINKADLKGNTKIALEAYIDLGLSLTVPAEGIIIDLDSLLKLDPNKDFLNGNLKTIKDKGFDKYLDIIKELSVDYNLKSLPYYSDKDITANVNIDGLDTISIGLKKGRIAVTKAQLDTLMNNAANGLKITSMNIVIPEGNFSIPRNKNIDVDIAARLATDGSVQIVGGTK